MGRISVLGWLTYLYNAGHDFAAALKRPPQLCIDRLGAELEESAVGDMEVGA